MWQIFDLIVELVKNFSFDGLVETLKQIFGFFGA